VKTDQVIEMAHDLAIAAAALVYVAHDDELWDGFMSEGARATDAYGVGFKPGTITQQNAVSAASHLLALSEAALRQLEPDAR